MAAICFMHDRRSCGAYFLHLLFRLLGVTTWRGVSLWRLRRIPLANFSH
jgi:hypothetical protein